MRPSLAYLPSPSQGVWHIGPLPIRAYALCIIAGIVAAIWISERRWVARGGSPGTVSDVAVRAVIFGLIGGRLYHVLTDPELYFGAGKHPIDVFKVWEGGLGIWGAISLGAVGAWLGCRAHKISLPPYADVAAPGIAIAQAIGRFGNYFNQELFGKPTTLPWGLKIDPTRPNTVPGAVAYQPTFLYEAVWDVALAGFLIWAERRYKLGRGRVFALYMMGYAIGRVWIEALRIDTANHILGLRLNIWTCIIVFLAGLILFLRSSGPRETVLEPAAETGAVDAEAVDAEAVDAESVDAEAVDAESVDAESVDAESVDAESVDAEAVDAEAVDAEAVDAEAVDAEAVDAEAVDAEAVDAEAVDAEAAETDGEPAVATEGAEPAEADAPAASGSAVGEDGAAVPDAGGSAPAEEAAAETESPTAAAEPVPAEAVEAEAVEAEAVEAEAVDVEPAESAPAAQSEAAPAEAAPAEAESAEAESAGVADSGIGDAGAEPVETGGKRAGKALSGRRGLLRRG